MGKLSKNLAACMRKIGGAHDINPKGPGSGEDSSSHVNPEPVTVDLPEVLIAGGPEGVVAQGGEDSAVKGKKRKTSEESGAFVGLSVDASMERVGDDEPVEGEPRNFFKFLADLPNQAEWKEMHDAGASSVLNDIVGVYGQLGVRIAGAATLAKKELLEAEAFREGAEEKEREMKRVKSAYSKLKNSSSTRINELEKSVSEAEKARDDAEKEARDLKKELEEARAALSKMKPEHKVLEEFRKSDAYSTELSEAAASKLYRCWVVAEKHLKTDPHACWDTFINHYEEAEERAEDGLGEPTPYSGPNPLIAPGLFVPPPPPPQD